MPQDERSPSSPSPDQTPETIGDPGPSSELLAHYGAPYPQANRTSWGGYGHEVSADLHRTRCEMEAAERAKAAVDLCAPWPVFRAQLERLEQAHPLPPEPPPGASEHPLEPAALGQDLADPADHLPEMDPSYLPGLPLW